MQRTPASRKGSAKNRGNSCQRKHPAEILALGPSCASHRRSSNANSLCGRKFGWITGNLCDLSKGYFATTFLSSSPLHAQPGSRVPPTEESRHCCSYMQRREGRPSRRKPGSKAPVGGLCTRAEGPLRP